MSETTVRAITTADDLDAMRDDYLERTKDVTLTVMLCSGASCLSSQADEIEDERPELRSREKLPLFQLLP